MLSNSDYILVYLCMRKKGTANALQLTIMAIASKTIMRIIRVDANVSIAALVTTLRC